VQECRGEIVSLPVKASSPDGAVQLESFPVRSFSWTDDPGLLQAMQAGAGAGGCAINDPFDAARFLSGFAKRDLNAKASNITVDKARLPLLLQQDQQANEISRRYDTHSVQTSTIAYGDLTFSDGTAGIAHVLVTNSVMRKPNMLGPGSTTITTTMVPHCVVVRFPKERREEARRVLEMVMASSRINPVWQQAKDNFLTQLGQVEHAGRMERIRLTGEQSRAFAQAQNAASEQRMRDWESRQAAGDAQQHAFVQTIREVETWRDASGGVELSAGYDHAWSRGDGSYLLSNAPQFDPSTAFDDAAWKPMERARK
jgi:hypothetical protein